jgi:hypothetical protein
MGLCGFLLEEVLECLSDVLIDLVGPNDGTRGVFYRRGLTPNGVCHKRMVTSRGAAEVFVL